MDPSTPTSIEALAGPGHGHLEPAAGAAGARPMRIAVIAPPWLPVPPVGYGGTELVLDNLCRGLRDAGQEVLLCTTGDSTCPVETTEILPRSVGTCDMRAVTELRHVVGAYERIATWGADVVHDHTVTGPFYAGGTALPVVTTNHGPFDDDLLPLYRALAGRVPVIAISHHQASTAAGVPIAAVIHHAVDVQRFPVGTGRGGYALFLGRMTPDKGVEAAIAVARSAGVPLRIAAKMREPDEFDFFERAVVPQLGPDVEYVGEVGGDDKLLLLGDAVCLLNPIAWPEPFGMVMVEALACGTPVVGTPEGAAPEIVEDGVTGHLRRDHRGLTAALLDAAALDRAACRRSVERRFGIARMADDHLRLYRRVCSEAAGATSDWRPSAAAIASA
jgi:glycosyltransferase involved in cell wall biosynthesis